MPLNWNAQDRLVQGDKAEGAEAGFLLLGDEGKVRHGCDAEDRWPYRQGDQSALEAFASELAARIPAEAVAQ